MILFLYGRKSFDLWGQYIPKNEDPDTEKELWKLVHSKKKYVFSRTQNEIDNQAIFINDNILEEVNKLKKILVKTSGYMVERVSLQLL